MLLRKIEITGFKSFSQKTILDFFDKQEVTKKREKGITAIVGPNGSGKSNISDALRWVMGEQSMKSIRGKKAEDIIFAGSGSKARLGSAQVSIYLDNTSKKIPLDFEEVIITRKVFRSGESEYIINGSRVRLTDVIDILAKIGVGQRSYCIINQGMADKILNASALERRFIFEEAAGVKEFQVKKERSQRKLKSTKNNLKQAENLLLEIEPHLKMLKRQNNKAMKGEAYRKELRERQHQLYGFLWHQLMLNQGKSLKIKNKLKQTTMVYQRTVEELLAKIKDESSKTVSLQDEISQEEKFLRELNQKLNNLAREIIVEEGKLELEKERLKNIKEVEVLPVNMKIIKEKLLDIKIRQEELIKRIDETKKLSNLQELKEYARAITQQLYEFYEAIVRGKFEKKKPAKELEQQRTINLKGMQEKLASVKEKKREKEKWDKLLKKTEEKINKLIKKDREERREVIVLEDKLRRKRFELDKSKERLNEVEIELARFNVREEDLINRIQQEMKIKPKQLKYNNEKIEVSEMEAKINKLKFHLEQIGGIDETILEEFKETQKRYDFLVAESNDLREASKKLTQVIKEMESRIKGQFEETFKCINKEFNHYFKIIFNGGKAKLNKVKLMTVPRKNKKNEELAEEDENGENDKASEQENAQVGVEVIAEPPGKKINNLNMLSGGERTLTSIALLFAIIAHNPPPFILLDEIEAALDEANSKRFGKIIGELSNKTQFILITHNRQTMKEATKLYGVTMGDDGISKLLSVKLNQVGVKGEIKQ